MLALKQISNDGEIHKTNVISSWNTMPYRGYLGRRAVCLNCLSIRGVSYHRIIEYPKLERIHKDHQVQLPAPCRTA